MLGGGKPGTYFRLVNSEPTEQSYRTVSYLQNSLTEQSSPYISLLLTEHCCIYPCSLICSGVLSDSYQALHHTRNPKN